MVTGFAGDCWRVRPHYFNNLIPSKQADPTIQSLDDLGDIGTEGTPLKHFLLVKTWQLQFFNVLDSELFHGTWTCVRLLIDKWYALMHFRRLNKKHIFPGLDSGSDDEVGQSGRIRSRSWANSAFVSQKPRQFDLGTRFCTFRCHTCQLWRAEPRRPR